MAYPGKGAWVFRNLDRAYTYWPQLESISIKAEQPTGLATFDARVVLTADNAGLVFDTEDECEVLFAGERIWAGHVKGTTEDTADEGAEPAYTLAGQDYTAKLDDALIRRRKKRKRERVRRRVRWILSYMRPNIWQLAGIELSNLPASNPYVEAYDYYGASVREALEHVADELRLHFYVDLDNRFQMFRNDTMASPFGLDNESPDYSATYPFRRWTHEKESTELANAVLVEPEQRKMSQWTRDATSVAAYGRQERFVSDSNLGGKIAAQNVGARAIAQAADPDESSTLICWEPGLAPGQTVHVKEAVFGHDFDRIIESVEIRAVDPHDEAGEAMLVSTVTLTDRRRPKGRHKGGGATSGSVNKVIRGRPGATVDTGPHTLDSYGRVVTPPTLTPGSSVGTIVVSGIAQAYRHFVGDTVGSEVDFEWIAGRSSPAASEHEHAQPHTSRPSWSACGGLDYCFIGFRHVEQWWEITIPAHPTDQGGISFTTYQVAGKGYGSVAPSEVVVADAQPTAMGQGVAIGQLTAWGGTQTIFIPGALIPAAGATMWIGTRPTWNVTSRDDPYAYVCGWPSYSGFGAHDHDNGGVPYGGFAGSASWNGPAAATWQVWSASAPALGQTDEPSDAPWAGGNTVHDAGSEGEGDAWAFGDGSFSVSADTPSGKGIYLVGEREDDDEPNGPWSDVSWAHEITFSIDAHGDTSAAGTRSIESTTTGEGERAIGRVHLGDPDHAEGISVAGPTGEVYLARALTLDELWKAKFDTRSALYVRGKLWKAGSGEPTAWDVEAPLSETEDALDRWTLWLRAGNVGTTQGLQVHKVVGFEGAVAGQRVVKEYLGRASGTEKAFRTAHPYRTDTLRVYVNGVAVAPATQDGPDSTFGLDFWPTARSIMRATYIAD